LPGLRFARPLFPEMREERMADNHPPFTIHVDAQVFKVDKATMNGAEIKALAGKDASYQLFEELPGNEPDKLIPDNESVTMKNGLHFYTVPPATFGS